MKILAKIALWAFSLVLIASTLIGVVMVTNRNSNINSDKINRDRIASTTMKTLTSVCAPTLYKEACMGTLRRVARNTTFSPKDYLRTALQAAVLEVKNNLDIPLSLVSKTNDTREIMALETCKEMLHFAVKDVEKASSRVGNSDMSKINESAADIQNWLSGVLSFQGACLNELNLPEFQTVMEDGMLNATRLTSNALSIVNQMASFLGTLDLELEIPKSRRLLSAGDEHVFEHDGEFPTWFSGPDRKLLVSHGTAGNYKPNAVVAKDGSGQYKTITAALAACPKNNKGRRFIIYVKAGIYNEDVTVAEYQENVFMYGDGPKKTIITGRKSNAGGVSTAMTATFAVVGNGFMAKNMAFRNTAGPDGRQAVALRSQSEKSVFYKCRMDAHQDTLYVQSKRQFYRNCVIAGTVDFIFGDSATIIQNSLIIARLPNRNQQNVVTAQGRLDPGMNTGIVLHNCRIVPDIKLFPMRRQVQTYLGRPWKPYSRTVIMESTIGDHIQPAGWMPWSESTHHYHNTLFYGEYRNRGPGAVTKRRVNWKGFKVITNRNAALQFTPAFFLRANQWLNNYGVPFLPSLKN